MVESLGRVWDGASAVASCIYLCVLRGVSEFALLEVHFEGWESS